MQFQLPDEYFSHDAQQGGFFPESHVGIDIEGFGSKQNILIEGIRGTGKTHILLMVQKYFIDNFDRSRVLPVYLSLAPINIYDADIQKYRLYLYTNLVKQCVDTIKKYEDQLDTRNGLKEKALERIRRLFLIKTKLTFNEMLDRIVDVSDLLLDNLQYDIPNYSRTKSKSDKKTSSIGGKGTLTTKTPSVDVSLTTELDSSHDLETGLEEQINFVGSKLSHNDAPAFLLEFLHQLQEIMELEHALILLDECSESSKLGQIEVFRLFKSIRSWQSNLENRKNVAYFVGTVYPRGQTYYPSRTKDGFSFEPIQDCTMEYLQWDETDLDTYIKFFENMMVKRAYSLFGFGGSFKDLENVIFDKRRTFLLAAYGAHGIPRRFWEILRRSYDRTNNQVGEIGVINALHDISNSAILTHDITDDDMYLIEKLANLLYGRNQNIRGRNNKNKKKGNFNSIPQSIYFSIPKSFGSILNRLIMNGAIHDKSRMRTSSRSSRPQPIYALDLAVAYTYDVIPVNAFVEIVSDDLPRAPRNNFHQSVHLRRGQIQKIIERVDDPSTFSLRIGYVKSFNMDNKNGYIWLPDKKAEVFFWQTQVLLEERHEINKGDKVQFRLNESDGVYQAVEIEVKDANHHFVEDGRMAFGFVKNIVSERGFGFIETLDHGPDVFFHVSDLQNVDLDELQISSYVEFNLKLNSKGRFAENIFVKDVD